MYRLRDCTYSRRRPDALREACRANSQQQYHSVVKQHGQGLDFLCRVVEVAETITVEIDVHFIAGPRGVDVEGTGKLVIEGLPTLSANPNPNPASISRQHRA